MKRSSADINSFSQSKKSKLSKEEKKILSKQARKLRMYETKKNSLIKDCFQDDCEYYFENGLRKVYPYFYTYQTTVKERWLNKLLVDVFMNEFYSDNAGFIESRIEKGYLLINNKTTNTEYCLKHSDIITHRIHRHELPVLNQPITIIHEDENVLVVCKPSSIPIHSVSKYHFNTVIGILTRFHGMGQLRIVHRIDRMTSGILIFGKNYETSVKLSSQIHDRQVSKYYLAVVKGRFNEMNDEPIECNVPLGSLCQKVGLACVLSTEEGGKVASTKFMFLKYNSKFDSSLVLCKPLTGRTHQIRIHLQYLGYPIFNDPLYNCSAWGPDIGKNGIYHKSKEQLIEDLISNHTIAVHRMLETGNFESLQHVDDNSDITNIPDKHFDPDCDECKYRRTYNIDPLTLVLYLHAYRYRSTISDWDFNTDLPEWANDFFTNVDERKSLTEKLDYLTKPAGDF